MIVTKAWINEHKTNAGSWTKAQLIALGVWWPAKRGWIGRLSGSSITDAQADNFIAGKGSLINIRPLSSAVNRVIAMVDELTQDQRCQLLRALAICQRKTKLTKRQDK